SMVSGPTNNPPARRLFIRLPAPRAVLDLRRALGLLRAPQLLRLLRLQDGDAHGFPGGRFRGLVGGGLGLLAIPAATEPAGGVEIAGGGCSSTHFGLPFVAVRPASTPSVFRSASSTQPSRGLPASFQLAAALRPATGATPR